MAPLGDGHSPQRDAHATEGILAPAVQAQLDSNLQRHADVLRELENPLHKMEAALAGMDFFLQIAGPLASAAFPAAGPAIAGISAQVKDFRRDLHDRVVADGRKVPD